MLALVGSLVGGVVGMVVGVPIPIIGSLAAAPIFGGLGAMVGAMLGESWLGRDFESSLEIGKAAFVGRMLGTLGKLIVGSVMVVVVLRGDCRLTPAYRSPGFSAAASTGGKPAKYASSS